MHHPSPDHAVVNFAGPDALSFLQSQLTNDVAALAVGAWQWQGYCSAKGRLYATFALARIADDRFVAVVHASVVATLTKRLTMFRLRAKLVIETKATDISVLHLAQPQSAPSTLATLDLGSGRWITIEAVMPVADSTPSPTVEADEFMCRWNLAGIDAMQPEITVSTTEMFVPQMIGWDTVKPGGGVSFSKGCYPGQEVVARAHYRGAVKRRLERVQLAANDCPPSGSAVSLPDGRDAEVCNAAKLLAGECHLLVVAAEAHG